ncbi:YuzB family protein [Planococcus sp. N028]|uniref:YuzB family protein n=1 Tax=Planococcus shixiaomingii TaxID=3058393 RepID=A0ABT8N6S7_9BACL|nr:MULTISPECIES: YuzB family protein [unclassified Planococcus (in: firmicutes)]MDN7243594.1 YuzB family protein [Planococcus sp. N028]WKA56029.1 YuzB family protein [Planococcus sp. N022]
MKPIVEFCISNIANGAQDSFEKLEKDSNLDVLDYGCLSYCTQCSESLYALVNGEIVEADSPEELTQKVYDFIEENPLF